MRAKFQVDNVEILGAYQQVTMRAVCDGGFGPNGESEDNTYARWTPSGTLTIGITNPALHNKIRVGQKFYMDFIEAEK